jgi:hypothetical protein
VSCLTRILSFVPRPWSELRHCKQMNVSVNRCAMRLLAPTSALQTKPDRISQMFLIRNGTMPKRALTRIRSGATLLSSFSELLASRVFSCNVDRSFPPSRALFRVLGSLHPADVLLLTLIPFLQNVQDQRRRSTATSKCRGIRCPQTDFTRRRGGRCAGAG